MNLKELRTSRGYQRKFIVSQIRISGKHLNDVEGGRVNLTDSVATRLANFYNIDVNSIKKMYEEGKYEKQGNFEETKGSPKRN